MKRWEKIMMLLWIWDMTYFTNCLYDCIHLYFIFSVQQCLEWGRKNYVRWLCRKFATFLEFFHNQVMKYSDLHEWNLYFGDNYLLFFKKLICHILIWNRNQCELSLYRLALLTWAMLYSKLSHSHCKSV